MVNRNAVPIGVAERKVDRRKQGWSELRMDVFPSDWASLRFAAHQISQALLHYYHRPNFYMTIVFPIAVINLILILAVLFWKYRTRAYEALAEAEAEAAEAAGSSETAKPEYRFRKRDKIKFFSRKLMRGVKNKLVGEDPKFRKKSRGRKNSWLSQVLGSSPTAFPRPRGPPSFLLETCEEGEVIPEGLDVEIYYILRSIKVFGHFEDITVWGLCKDYVTDQFLSKDTYLFTPGQVDDSIFVVIRGELVISIRDEDGNETRVKTVREGESVISLLSVLDVIIGNKAAYKTVCAKATQDTKVLKVNAQGFRDVLLKKPDHLLHFVQTILYRLLHVTLTTLHNYLGLSHELTKHSLKDRPIQKRRLSSGEKAMRNNMRRTSLIEEEAPHLVELGAGPVDSRKQYARSVSLPDSGVPALSSTPEMSEDRGYLQQIAIQQLTKFFGLEEEEGKSLLASRVTVDTYPINFHVLEQGSKDTSLYYVLSGSLQLRQKSVMVTTDINVLDSIVNPGEMVGGLAVMSAEPSYYIIKSRQSSRVARISRDHYLEILMEKPSLVLPVAESVLSRLSPFVRAVDFSLDWEMCEPGRAVFIQGRVPECLHVVLTGRLRSIHENEDGSRELVEEFGRGDMVGMSEVFSQKPHTSTVSAIRYSELAKIPVDLLDYIKLKFPQVLIRMVQLMSQASYHQKCGPKMDLSLPNAMNLHTIAVMGISPDVPIQAFTLELYYALSQIKTTLRLSSRVIEEKLGEGIVEQTQNFRLFHWLNTKEDEYSVVIYQCDPSYTTWTKRCIRQADCVLLVANGDSDPSVKTMEQKLEQKTYRETVRARKELVLLWKEDTESPQGTQEWLQPRNWVSSHHHIRAPNRMYRKASAEKILEYYEHSVLPQDPSVPGDLSRLARLLTGTSIGLVLGGGGARGAAHVGIIEAMQDAGVPVDIVAGVSIGSLIGGIYCENQDIKSVEERATTWFSRMSPFLPKLLDCTYPYSALLKGASFNNTLRELFEEKQIEDLWIPYFCLSTDITSFQTRVHKSGGLWWCVRASMSYAGVLPPICDPVDGHLLVDGCYTNTLPGPLWSYCRASMSLAGYLPPLCDPEDGHLLMDGGYVNNLPADVMRSLGVRTVIAVDVGAEDETNLYNYGDSLSGFWVMYKKWMPWTEKVRVLSMGEIQSRLQYVSCVRQLEVVKKAPYCRYIRPPIDQYKTMDFKLFEEIKLVGYKHGRTIFDNSENRLNLGELLLNNKEDAHRELGHLPRPPSRTPSSRSQSFTDIAAAIGKIPVHDKQDSTDDDEELSDVIEEEEEDLLSDQKRDSIDDSVRFSPDFSKKS